MQFSSIWYGCLLSSARNLCTKCHIIRRSRRWMWMQKHYYEYKHLVEYNSSCGKTLDTITGTITSPSYPSQYPSGTKCVWKIPNTPPNQIEFVFSLFDIQEGLNGTIDCNTDRLEFWNVYDTPVFDTPKLIGSYCGNVPPVISSDWNANGMEIVFSSDLDVQKAGFAFNYYSVRNRCAPFNGNCRHGCLNTENLPACVCTSAFKPQNNNHDCVNQEGYEFELTAFRSYGAIYSPHYGSNYDNYDKVYWIITTVPGYRVNVTITNFNTEDCCDHLTFYDGSSAGDTVLATFSGTSYSYPVMSSGNQMYVTFITDQSNVASGFYAYYSASCGGTFQAESKEKYILSHPEFGYDTYGGPISNCLFFIEAPYGYSVEMAFTSFDITDTTPLCDYDQVSVYEGANSSFPKVGTFCNAVPPPPIFRSRNGAFSVYFTTNDSISGEGFSLVYRAVLN